MLRSTMLGLLLAAGLACQVNAQEIVIKTRPPHAVVETRGVAPGAGYVWVSGYHRYEGNAYVWTPGRWDRPPHEHQRWVAHQWVHRNGGYVLVEGHWR
jgi:hypothetical protein